MESRDPIFSQLSGILLEIPKNRKNLGKIR